MKQHFPSGERLKRRTTISALFREGASTAVYPLRAFWMAGGEGAEGIPVQAAVSVPKKNFRHAVDRNHLRRQIKEAYRLQKYRFFQRFSTNTPPLSLLILYVAKEPVEYALIHRSMKRLLEKIELPA